MNNEKELEKKEIFKMTPKQYNIIVATMELTVERGINGFSLSTVAQKAGTSERLIYAYYGSKKNLLFSCFTLVNQDIAAAYADISDSITDQSLEKTTKTLWTAYFDTLVKGGYSALFYHAFRNSEYIEAIKTEEDKELPVSYIDPFMEIFDKLNDYIHIGEQVDIGVFWDYIIGTTVSFAEKVIKGNIDQVEAYRESAWKMIFGGISALLPKE